MTEKDFESQYERAIRSLGRTMVKLAAERARERDRTRRQEATRHYRLGVLLEQRVREDAELRARVEALVREEKLPRVRAAFGVDQEGPSWFDEPERFGARRSVDTRRFRIGAIFERLAREDDVLRSRTEALLKELPPDVQSAPLDDLP